ncbi:MAG TPA: FAD-dependent oxidoreductase, partial [Dehalococcoidia bacterium]|nr:FAD-dependent oxidoreductase [Dehalococcoidia bacterium]
MAEEYDVLIIGGGLAGMTAALFAARHGLKTALLERLMGGASIVNVEKIENFPGFPQGIAGAELGPLVQEQAMNAGAQFLMGEATDILRDGEHKVVSSDAGSYRAKALVLAAGSTLRHLGIPGEAELNGRGVSHCATCDGPLYAGQVVGVVGGGDSAADEALTLTRYAGQVLLFHRRDQLRAQHVLQEQLVEHPKVELLWNTVVERVLGEEAVSGVRVRNTVTKMESSVELSGLFVYVGLQPNSALLQHLVKLDGSGHVPVNAWMETSVPGLYAVGDLRQHSAAQLVSVAGGGATA